ncbi:pyridoxamine 5'-phosphate oxidase family protein [Myceligenerans indicum]|uniref:Pyridoxamine 5'-phosphate oxidase family protein n=1 Tax=Myceligenerans indicum TaxID=2593663 RepID=A0ABS1LL13_9MICO|nr:pyridoxamine 5'-phosphate oxidase family protein [Myceligenerans indicum]MBL0886950.1 pyridoxamine 5'-phosphate oxidase family protein [Myceligenerans indicum]
MTEISEGETTLERLSAEECHALLETIPIGRIVFTENALPAIQPVNFVLDGTDIVVRTRRGSKLVAAAHHAVVAFEVDDYDPDLRTGWSVVLIGRARVVRDEGELEHLRRLPLATWATGDRPHFIKVEPNMVRGRRLRRVGTHPPAAGERSPQVEQSRDGQDPSAPR